MSETKDVRFSANKRDVRTSGVGSGLVLNIALYWNLGHECCHGIHAEIREGRVPLHTACSAYSGI